LNLLPSHLLSEGEQSKIFETIYFPLGLHGCETWALTLREHRLRAFENRVPRKLLGPKRVPVTKYNLNEQKKKDEQVTGTHGQSRNACSVLVEKPERKRPLGRARHNNFKVDLREGTGSMNGIRLVEVRDRRRAFVNTVKFREMLQ
jgi:hypothetical protein